MTSNQISLMIVSVSLVIVFLCLFYTSSLEDTFVLQEQKRVQQWAKATEMLIAADEGTDISFVTSIIEDNTTIPVYMLDKDNNILLTRNVRRPVKDPTTLHGPIVVKVSDEITQYIYYEDSTMIRKLRYFPYIELSLIFIFFAIAVYSLRMSQRNEENKVWIGLCKETAHQLGTPISSLNAWYELLLSKCGDKNFLYPLRQDIDRLSTIAYRFSNIGSKPLLKPTDIEGVIEESIEYMRKRVGSGVEIKFIKLDAPVLCMLNAPLLSWVMENLIKNATDAMKGSGQITIRLAISKEDVIIDVTDTGCGMDKRTIKRIFLPGFTTKSRGWGLGMSLCKRIITNYHHGEIFVQSSSLEGGTTIRIVLVHHA